MLKPLAIATLGIAASLYLLRDSFDPKSVAGKRILVTGASSGIGEQLAYEYSKLGARLVIVARRAQLLDAVAERCRKLGAAVTFPVVADLGEVSDRRRVVLEVQRRLGGLDQLVANHAVMPMALWHGTYQNVTDAMALLNVNFVSYVDLASALLPMLMQSHGSIGVVASIMGKMGSPGIASYCASKFAVIGFFSSLRLEQEYRGTGVSVTTVILGPVATDLAKLTSEQKRRSEQMALDIFASPKDTAIAIIRGVTTRQPEVYYSRLASIIVTMHFWFPRWTEHLFGQYTYEVATT